MAARTVDIQDYSLDLQAEAQNAAAALRAGELVLLPTETVYGIAAKLNSDAALFRLAELRAANGPLTPHLPDISAAGAYLGEVNPLASRLMQKLWPGPVGLVFEVGESQQKQAAEGLGVEASMLFSSEGEIVLRCPDEALTQSVLRAAGQPVVLTRAGLPHDASADRVPTQEELPTQVSLVLDNGPTRYSKPSSVLRVREDGWEIIREGIYDARIIERLLRTTVLFICSGNTCRSPMAMALARSILAKELGVEVSQLGEKGFDVISAGAFAMPGMRATPQAVEAIEAMGGDLASHRSQPLSVGLIHRADLIITMSASHRAGVLDLLPSAAEKTVLLDPKGDIEDPIGADATHYRDLAQRMERLIRDRLHERILNSA